MNFDRLILTDFRSKLWNFDRNFHRCRSKFWICGLAGGFCAVILTEQAVKIGQTGDFDHLLRSKCGRNFFWPISRSKNAVKFLFWPMSVGQNDGHNISTDRSKKNFDHSFSDGPKSVKISVKIWSFGQNPYKFRSKFRSKLLNCFVVIERFKNQQPKFHNHLSRWSEMPKSNESQFLKSSWFKSGSICMRLSNLAVS